MCPVGLILQYIWQDNKVNEDQTRQTDEQTCKRCHHNRAGTETSCDLLCLRADDEKQDLNLLQETRGFFAMIAA